MHTDYSNEVSRTVPNNRCGCRPRQRHDLTKTSLAFTVLFASLYTTTTTTDALSLPGRRLFRRHVATTSSRTSIELGPLPHHHYDELSLFDEGSVISPASASPLFTSSSYRARERRESRRHFVITQHRKKLFRREANFQLNYRDHDEELLSLTIRPRTLRRAQRKSLSKTLFPPVVDENYVDDGVVSDEEYLDGMHDEDIGTYADLEAPEWPSLKSNGIGNIIRKKKKDQVVVSNINELYNAIHDRGLELRDIELKYSPPPQLLSSERKPHSAGPVEQPTLTNSDEVQRASIADELNPDYELSQLTDLTPLHIELEDDNEPNAEEWQLIGNVLAEDSPFSMEEKNESSEVSNKAEEQLFSHDVLNILSQRYHTQSTPMHRAPDDTAKLALTIEGGGMRGAVSGGMAAAIACLGLSNAFDSIYGSSAGSIIGSYFVSRQLYLDVYTDVIPAGKDLFVSKSKIFGDIFRNAFHAMKLASLGKKLNANVIERWSNPAGANATSMDMLPPTRAGGLNISFVLDSIMCPDQGLRPLDLEAFAHNDAVQPLRIVTSTVELETGKLKNVCFGSKEGHFRDGFADPEATAHHNPSPKAGEYLYPEVESAEADGNGNRRGLWACLGASMLVPGAADSPYRMYLSPSDDENGVPTPHLCFDAFCYEPVPFRSAVAEGATHVVALRSKPAGFEPKTKPTFYERAVAPLYFRSNGAPITVAEFFEKGGQQYLYAEDVLLCDHGLNSTEPIPIPPAKVLYAAPEATLDSETDRENWARAHLLPITVPADVPEVATLAHDRDEILAGMRAGFAAAYDALSPVVGLEPGPDSLDGMQVAELVFPKEDAPKESVLEKQFPLAGEKLGKDARAATDEEIISTSAHGKESAANTDLSSVPSRYARFRRLLSIKRAFRFTKRANDSVKADASTSVTTSPPLTQDADALFSFLPGVQLGGLPMVAERLQTYLENHSFLDSA